MGWIVQALYHSPIEFHLWMSTWWFNLVSEPDPSEMEVVNLLRVDWFCTKEEHRAYIYGAEDH